MSDDLTLCSIQNCNRPAYCKKLCQRHYDENRKQTGPRCEVPDCGRPKCSGKYCALHYRRLVSTGSLVLVRPRPRSVCSVEGCDQLVLAKELCRLHYKRRTVRGSLGGGAREVAEKGTPKQWIENLLASPLPDTCIVWPFGKCHGYGQYNITRGQPIHAHRYILQQYTGEAGDELEACHGPCHNRLCVNPLHLKWGTTLDNCLDKRRDGTMNIGEVNGKALLTEAKVREMRALRQTTDATFAKLGQQFGVSREAARHAVTGRTWSHV